jgi:hypothetical protein
MMARWRRVRTLGVITVMIVSVVLIAGCTRGTGGSSSGNSCAECTELLKLYPWLEKLGFAVLWGLVQQNGWNIFDILAQAFGLLAG